jgi:hypothetical protein
MVIYGALKLMNGISMKFLARSAIKLIESYGCGMLVEITLEGIEAHCY